jgi:hypothetical protein
MIPVCLSLLCSILPFHTLTSCGPNLSADESRLALFRTELDGKSGFRPFNYGENLFARMETNPDKTDQQLNSMEWVAFSNNEVKKEDVFQVQCLTRPDSFLRAYKSGDWHAFKNNSFIRWLQKKENLSSLEYMSIAKKVEASFQPPADPWDTIEIKKPSLASLTSLEAVDAVTKHLPVFLKERYSFQAVKLLYYGGVNGHYEALHNIYDKNLKGKKTIVAAWAMFYYGMTQEDRNERTSTLLNAFDASDEKKHACYLDISKEDINNLEKNTSDSKTRLLINTLRAIKNNEQSLKEIDAVYQEDPKSKYVPFLITREINKLENWIWSGDILGFYANYRLDDSATGTRNYKKVRLRDEQYLDAFSNWISNHLNPHEPFLVLAKVHLLNMQRKFADAQNLLNKLPGILNNNLEIQRQIEKIIILSQSASIIAVATKQEIVSSIKKMMALDTSFKFHLNHGFENGDDYYNSSENEDDLAELMMLLSNSYKNAGDILTASLLFSKMQITVNAYGSFSYSSEGDYYNSISFLDRYGSPEDIDRLLQFKHDRKKTAFEKLITPVKWDADDKYKELKGTILVRQKKYKEAMDVFNQISPTYWNDHYQFKDNLPSYSVTHTGGLIPGEKSKPKEYPYVSKKLILKDILDLQEKINTTNDYRTKAMLNYQLANCYFNISYFGKAWMMFSYGRWADDFKKDIYSNYNWADYSFYPNSIKYRKDYYEYNTAIETYKKALNLTRDKELAAKCLLALNYCVNAAGNFNLNNYSSKNNDPGYLKLLTKKYATTYNFKEAAQFCPDVIDYLKKNQK